MMSMVSRAILTPVNWRLDLMHVLAGFKMSHMAKEIYDEALIDVIGPAALLGDVVTIKVRFSLGLQCLQKHPISFFSL